MISVIIPNYNYGHLLPRALDSVLSQLSDDDELIVIDVGSKDNSLEMLSYYAERYPQLRFMVQANAGAAAARNRGVREARGEYALMLDADDELMPGAISSFYAALKANPLAGMIMGGHVSVYPDGRERTRRSTPVPKMTAKGLIRLYLMKKKISISHSCSLFRRSFLMERPYAEDLRSGGEDLPVFAYLLVAAPVVLIDKPLARIYKHDDSLRHSKKGNAHDYVRKMVEEVFEKLPNECQSMQQRYLAQRYLSLFRAAYLRKDSTLALCHYRDAFRLNPVQALKWNYVRKMFICLYGW